MNKTQLFSFFPMSLLSHSFHVSPNICLPPDSLAPQPSRLYGDFSYFFDWYGPSAFLVASCVYTSTIYHKNKALSLKCTPQQTNYQVTSSTEKLKFVNSSRALLYVLSAVTETIACFCLHCHFFISLASCLP